MFMYRGTTPTIPITIKGVDLSEAKLYLTFANKAHHQITLECPRDFNMTFNGTDTVGEVTLTQKQTLELSATPYDVQIRWITSNGIAGVTTMQTVNVSDVLLKGVITYD
jgi:hypothetical protein